MFYEQPDYGISSYELRALTAIAIAARDVFREWNGRPETDVERFAGILAAQDANRLGGGFASAAEVEASAQPITLDAALDASTVADARPLACVADAYLTALDAAPANDAMARAAAIFGNSDLAGRLTVIIKAAGYRQRMIAR